MEDGKSNRRLKRRHVEIPDESAGPEVDISGKLHHHLKEIRKAAKKAKTFEIQKLVKKLKGLRRKDKPSQEISDVEAQLEVLKRTDHEPIATTALKAKLNKDRILSRNADVQAAISTELSANLLVLAAPGTTAAKVQGRLLSSKPLASDVAAVIENLKAFFQSQEPKDSMEAYEDDLTSDTGVLENPQKAKRAHSLDSPEPDDSDGDIGNIHHPEQDQDDGGWESGTDGDDLGFVSGSLDGDTSSSSDEGFAINRDNDSQEEAVSGDLQINPSGGKATMAKTARTQSAFLPSLSVGYIRGDSGDMEWSDSDAKIADTPLKKNRRGQRARQAIWEKKYGKGANHKIKLREAEATAGRKLVHRSNSAAVHQQVSLKKADRPYGQRRHPPPTNLPQTVDSGWEQHGQPQSSMPASRHGTWQMGGGRQNALHPSWEAKKKLKEKQNAGIVPPQGKKIKFS